MKQCPQQRMPSSLGLLALAEHLTELIISWTDGCGLKAFGTSFMVQHYTDEMALVLAHSWCWG